MTDADLIRAVGQGSQAAMATLYQRYLPSLWRYAHAQLRGDVPAAEDVVSETFLAFLRGVGRMDPDAGPLGPWLMSVARNKLADHWRREGKRQAGPVSDPIANGDPEKRLEDRECVATAMAAIDDEERLTLEWKYVEGLSVRQIAQRLGRSDKAIESLLFRARKAFRLACG
jgi:RNA polymerase sigma-70 factor (ECF subfamily)